MDRKPVLSVIINNHNYGRFLANAIDSALSQDYQPAEVIVVDDGSTDNSRDVIAQYGNKVTAICKENGGQASAFNAGFARSHGDMVIFLDADDILLPSVGERVVEALCANPSVAKVMYRMEVIDLMGARTGITKPAAHLPMLSGDLRRHVLTFPDDVPWMPTSGNAFSARVLRQIFPIPEQAYGRVGADWYVAHLSPLFGPVVFLSEIGAYYRVHGENRYERSHPQLELDHVRQTIQYSSLTHAYIQEYATRLGLPGASAKPEALLSVSNLVNRMVSLKLDRQRHPIRGDSVPVLAWLGLKAALRRFDVSWPMRLFFGLWFIGIAVSPKPVARRLAEGFLIPEKRRLFNRIARLLHRGSSTDAAE